MEVALFMEIVSELVRDYPLCSQRLSLMQSETIPWAGLLFLKMYKSSEICCVSELKIVTLHQNG